MDVQRIDDEFGAAVRAQRNASEMSQDDLASAVGKLGYSLSQATIGKIERGDRKVTVGEAAAIAKALGTSAELLVLGPSFVSREILAKRLRILRSELIDAARAFDSGRSLVASEAYALDEYDVDWLRDSVLESVEDVIDSYRKDTVVANDADDRRDEMDGPTSRRTFDGLYGEYRVKFGNTVPGVIHPRAAEVILGRNSSSDG